MSRVKRHGHDLVDGAPRFPDGPESRLLTKPATRPKDRAVGPAREIKSIEIGRHHTRQVNHCVGPYDERIIIALSNRVGEFSVALLTRFFIGCCRSGVCDEKLVRRVRELFDVAQPCASKNKCVYLLPVAAALAASVTFAKLTPMPL